MVTKSEFCIRDLKLAHMRRADKKNLTCQKGVNGTTQGLTKMENIFEGINVIISSWSLNR